MTESNWPSPMTILALTGLVATLGAVLYFVLPVIGTAAGLFVAVSMTGLSTAGAVGAWVAPTATAGVAVIAVSLAVTVVKKVSDEVGEKPYEWGLPLLAAFAGLLTAIANDAVLEGNAAKWLLGVATTLLIVVAGRCYQRSSIGWKTV